MNSICGKIVYPPTSTLLSEFQLTGENFLECIFKFHFLFLEIEFNLTEILFCFIMYPDDPCSWKGVHYV